MTDILSVKTLTGYELAGDSKQQALSGTGAV
jgi:hypothetical protein